jgi:hypothetical protein
MYSLRKKSDINDSIIKYFSGSYPNKYLNRQSTFHENLNKELEARKTKSANVLFRKKLLENQTKQNYALELHRIRGYLSQNDSRLPVGTVKRLKEREIELQKLGGQIADEIK